MVMDLKGHFNTPLLSMNRIIITKNQYRNNIAMDLTDLDRTFHAIVAECTFFSLVYGTFFRLDHSPHNKTVSKNSKRSKS